MHKLDVMAHTYNPIYRVVNSIFIFVCIHLTITTEVEAMDLRGSEGTGRGGWRRERNDTNRILIYEVPNLKKKKITNAHEYLEEKKLRAY